jgi:hypothetical protein
LDTKFAIAIIIIVLEFAISVITNEIYERKKIEVFFLISVIFFVNAINWTIAILIAQLIISLI